MFTWDFLTRRSACRCWRRTWSPFAAARRAGGPAMPARRQRGRCRLAAAITPRLSSPPPTASARTFAILWDGQRLSASTPGSPAQWTPERFAGKDKMPVSDGFGHRAARFRAGRPVQALRQASSRRSSRRPFATRELHGVARHRGELAQPGAQLRGLFRILLDVCPRIAPYAGERLLPAAGRDAETSPRPRASFRGSTPSASRREPLHDGAMSAKISRHRPDQSIRSRSNIAAIIAQMPPNGNAR